MIEFRMPTLGSDMEAGTLVQWLKQPGDALTRGDIIAVVDTDKGAIEIEVFDAGVLERLLVEPGQKVPVGTVLALIKGDEGASRPPAGAPPAPVTPVAVTPAAVMPAPHAGVRASPAARRAADVLHVDLLRVTGTGPGGAITREDVERAAGPAPAGAAPRADEPAAPRAVDRAAAMRSAIASAMSRSKRDIPHLYLSSDIDMSKPVAWIAAANQKRPVERRLLPVVLLVKAVARAVSEVPELNGFWIDGAFRAGVGVHVGCAIALRGGGLVAPAIHDADRKDVDTVMAELLDLVARARRGTLRSSELADPTITITNLGDLGVEAAFAVIYPPQVAIVSFGKTVLRPWVVDGAVVARPVMTATLSADHRAVDGRRAGQFLAAIERRLQAEDEP
jgi:pyruvate dehydrogenase E2 component (dihydrolipoamide acetyltransferase)